MRPRRASPRQRRGGGRGPDLHAGRTVVAAIGHGAHLLISAGSIDGQLVTCLPGIRDDLRAAGASYRCEAVVLDGNLLTCRGADDLPAFAQSVLRMRAKVWVWSFSDFRFVIDD